MKRKIVLFVFLILSVFSLGMDKLRVGMEAGYAPFNWFQSDDRNGAVKLRNGYVGGYDVEIAKIIAEKLDMELEIVQSDWDSLLGPALNSDKIDVVIAGMSPTKKRKENLEFTNPYYESDLVIVVKNDSKYLAAKNIQEFSNSKLTAQLNTFHYTVLDQIMGLKKENASENFSNMIVALASGKIDGYISEKPGALSAKISNPNIYFVEFSKDNGFKYDRDDVNVAIALKKGNIELRNKINRILSEISIEQREEIMKRAIETQPNQSSDVLPVNFFGWIKYFIVNYWKDFLQGTLTTINLSLIGTFFGFIIGLILSLLRDERNVNKNSWLSIFTYNIFKYFVSIYVTFIRGTPMIVQAIIFYYGFSQITGINIPALTSALIIVSYNTGAYITEIIRGGIDSIEKGQYEAAQALGMNHFNIMRKVILPQSIRNVMPSVANEFIINIKDTSVLFSIGVTELFTTSKSIVGSHVRYYEVFVITCAIYFVLTYSLSKLFRYLEKKMDGNKEYEIEG
ncbi:ABC transporter substrate-binding protein/permease [Streptobacillus notomytis]|uniref:ABC transporter substrate-binding protein/permease n=1 Tax=Streptobacillus notomytis TaxID=1712031 RepID=UPI0009362E6B|nr:ABC transporter substrate-binding protein/permease [Streptobacillus notomytis]